MQSNYSCPADRPPAPPPRDSSRLRSALTATTLTATVQNPAIAHDSTALEVSAVDAMMLDDDDLSLDDTATGIADDDDDDDVDVHDVDADDDDLLPAPPTKHFLDYDSQPPPGFEDNLPTVVQPGHGCGLVVDAEVTLPHDEPDACSASLYPGEARRVDKKYETDGEISDFELATYSQTMRTRRAEKALSAEEQQVHAAATAAAAAVATAAASRDASTSPCLLRRRKHFLDENPIPPENEAHCVASIPLAGAGLAESYREHRSLDRNYERAKELCANKTPTHSQQQRRPAAEIARTASGSRRKETSFALARFLEQGVPKRTTGTWPTDRAAAATDAAGQHMHHSVYTTTGAAAAALHGDAMLSSTSSNAASAHLTDMGPRVECVYSLLSMLGCNDQIVMSRKFLELSQTPDTCAALRQSRCIPLIVQIIHSDEADEQTRKAAGRALHNVVNCHPDDKAGRREAKVLRHIEHVMEYCESLKQMLCDGEALADDRDRHPLQAMSSLMKISFDEEHRHAMCQLGALQAIASIVQYDHAMHGSGADGGGSKQPDASNDGGSQRPDDRCIALRRYAAMALTNLTFGDGNNKAALCSNRDFMRAFVGQLTANANDLLPVTANVLRNLSWRADETMKQVLSEIGTVSALTRAVMGSQSESTIKALLSALWNLSAHCTSNKAEFCAVNGALAFLVDMLTYESPSKTLTIVENAGGILRNVSSHVAVNEPYRVILRQRNCLSILLAQLSSESLTIVSNACGTLWNLSARCPEDQRFLIENKAVPRLSLLVHSKHKMISNGSSAALKNLMNFRPGAVTHNGLDTVAKAMRLRELPTLTARKQRAFVEGLDQTLGETCENIEVTTPPKESAAHALRFAVGARLTKSDTSSTVRGGNDGPPSVSRCESNGSLVSARHHSGGSLRQASHSSPSTPKRTASQSATVFQRDQHPEPHHHPDNHRNHHQTDQITDFSARYGAECNSPNALRVHGSTTATGPDSPENCIRYADEGTPIAYQSLDRVMQQIQAAEADEYITIETTEDGHVVVDTPTLVHDLETPLVFSRHSSVGSLSSVDVPDTHSVGTSEFSRLASGAISPSEIPDSPSHQMTGGGCAGAGGGDEAKIVSDQQSAKKRQQPPLPKQLVTIAAVFDCSAAATSLSSIDSNIEDGAMLQHAIRLGSKAKTLTHVIDPHSSIDSVEFNDIGGPNSTAILEQCIQIGMHKTASRLPIVASPKRSQLPLFKPSALRIISATQQPAPTTVAVVPELVAAPSIDNNDLHRSLHSMTDFSQNGDQQHALERSNEYPALTVSNCMAADDATDCSMNDAILCGSMATMNESNEFMLDEQELQMNTNTYRDNGDQHQLLVVNQTGAASVTSSSTISDKHKDPDLMLQSVDRFTQELVSTAEYLRSATSDTPTTTTTTSSPNVQQGQPPATAVYERKSSSTNTWNEDTCPNEVSFPSISWTAPVIGGDEDDTDNTISKSAQMLQPDTQQQQQNRLPETPETMPLISQPESLDTDITLVVHEHDADDNRSIGQQSANTAPMPSLPTDDDDSAIVTAMAPGSDTNNTTSSSTTTESGIRFHVGGPTFRDHHRLPAASTALGYQLDAGRHYTFDASAAAMTKSTIIALEANKLATDLLNRMPMHADGFDNSSSCNSSLMDLDDIRPPSGLDTCSAYFESQPNSMVAGGAVNAASFVVNNAGNDRCAMAAGAATVAPMFSPQLARRKKSLPAGLMAKRALHHFAAIGGGGSLESVHSSCNLENVKPPSIMDELMDSMISVASITSEVASPDNSQYDTAVSQMLRHDNDPDRTEVPHDDNDNDDDEDDTTTLRSCFDIPCDTFDGLATQQTQTALHAAGGSSDLSSADSTPVRKTRSIRRALTMKQKRQASKERYRTYTIAADMMLSTADDSGAGSEPAELDEDRRNDSDGYVTAGERWSSGNVDEGAHAAQTVEIEIVEGKPTTTTTPTTATPRLTPRQRRQEDRIRFQTQIIESYHLDTLKQAADIETTNALNAAASTRPPSGLIAGDIAETTNSSGSNSLDDDADMSSIRALTERFRFIQNAVPMGKPQSHQCATTELEPILGSDFESLEAESVHSVDDGTLQDDIDEQTYIVCAEPKTAAVSPPVQTTVVKPRIVKPETQSFHGKHAGNTAFEDDSKAIRGKKKAAYVSPYRMNQTPTTARSSKVDSAGASATAGALIKRPGAAISKLIATKNGGAANNTHVLLVNTAAGMSRMMPNGNTTGLVKPGYISNGNKSATNNAAARPTTSPAPAMPERQGTFVKDEPSEPLLAAAVPVVLSSPIKSTKLPTKTATGTSFVSKLRNPLQRSATVGHNVNKNTAASATKLNKATQQYQTNKSPNDPTAAPNKRRGPAAVPFYRSPSTPTVPQRSNSNVSLRGGSNSSSLATTPSTPNGSQPASRSNSNLSKPTGVTSRIASIWKKSDKAATTAPTQPTNAGKAASNGSKPAANTTTRLIRSSTFDNTPPTDASEETTAAPLGNNKTTVPLRRRPNGVNGSTGALVGTDAEKKRLSRLGTFINVEEKAH